jgi:hypothetical protein
VKRLAPAADARAAGWITGGVRGFAESVLSLVPAGFDAYVRVFHPARARSGAVITWAEIAAANGKHAHAGMQLAALTGHVQESSAPPFDGPPEIGSLPPELAAVLAALLGRHTTTPERCWFAAWHGFARLRDDVRSAPTFALPNREYLLLTGPVAAAAESVTDPNRVQSPNIWWPDDRAWCVATEIDLNTTYVGCSRACRDEVVASGLEALATSPATGITFSSDSHNPVSSYDELVRLTLDHPERRTR